MNAICVALVSAQRIYGLLRDMLVLARREARGQGSLPGVLVNVNSFTSQAEVTPNCSHTDTGADIT